VISDNLILWRNTSASSNVIEPTSASKAHFKITFVVSLPEETIMLVHPNFEARITPTVSNIMIFNYPPEFEQPLEDIFVTVVEGTSDDPLEFFSPKIID